MPSTAKAGPGPSQEPGTHTGVSRGCRGPRPWAMMGCFRRELDWRHRSQDLNLHATWWCGSDALFVLAWTSPQYFPISLCLQTCETAGCFVAPHLLDQGLVGVGSGWGLQSDWWFGSGIFPW